MLAAVLVAVSALSSLVSADLGKATLFPEGLHDPLNALDHSYDPPNSWVNVAAPQLCKQHAQDAGCNVNAVQARSVKYGDCSTPWTICRCDNANMNMDDIMYRFGEIPVGIRSYVGSALATRASGCSAGSGGDFIVFNGDCAESVFIHEASHSLDQGASQTSGWNDAIARSSCVPDPYANSSPAEDFAQVNVLFTYQCHIGSLPRDPACLQPQLNYFYDNSRINVVQGTSTCFPDKRPFTLSAASAKFVPGASKTVPYVPIKPTYTAVPSFNTTA